MRAAGGAGLARGWLGATTSITEDVKSLPPRDCTYCDYNIKPPTRYTSSVT
jgi:hypothetical protein